MWDWMGWDWVGYLPGANNKIRNEFYERFRIGFLTLTPSKFLREMERAHREAITCSAKSLHSGGGIGRNLSHQSVVSSGDVRSTFDIRALHSRVFLFRLDVQEGSDVCHHHMFAKVFKAVQR